MLEFKNVSKSYITGTERKPVLSGLSFSMPDNRISVLLGRSGTGKSTILRLIAAYESPDAGEIYLDNEKIAKPSAMRFMVFQSFNQLLPWKSVRQNIVYALVNARGLSKRGAEQEADYWLEKTGANRFKNELPSFLSGGMKQRAIIARAFAVKPRLLLLDEPFSALDSENKDVMLELVLTLNRDENNQIIFVTHDKSEAEALSPHRYVLNGDGSDVEYLFSAL